MVRSIAIAALLLVGQTSMASASAPCAGADPSLVSVAVTGVGSNGTLNRYQFYGTVTNLGNGAQGSQTLQSVGIYAGALKVDQESIPPLAAGESYAFSYASMRSRDAGKGTSTLSFRLEPPAAAPPACGNGCNRQTVTF